VVGIKEGEVDLEGIEVHLGEGDHLVTVVDRVGVMIPGVGVGVEVQLGGREGVVRVYQGQGVGVGREVQLGKVGREGGV